MATPRRKILQGVVVSDKMLKTRVVEVTRFARAPKYGKFIKISKKFKAHDETGEYKEGDLVHIEEARPLSKDKRWKIIGAIKKSENSQPL
ncbi:MAG: 30S ribosomal protein S17 [Patescibacteria group bacterium]